MKLWFNLAQMRIPECFSEDENILTEYISDKRSKGICSYSYQQGIEMGFVQEFEIPDKMYDKIKAKNFCFMLFNNCADWKPRSVSRISDNLTDLARQTSEAWGHPVSASYLKGGKLVGSVKYSIQDHSTIGLKFLLPQ